MAKKLYSCLICGYKGLSENPLYKGEYQKTFDICPCCDFEFGYSEDHDVRLGFIVTPDHLMKLHFNCIANNGLSPG